MVAMMFPAMLPIVLFYNKVVAKVDSNPSMSKTVGTPLLLLGYLSTYAGFGLVAYLSVFFALRTASSLAVLSSLVLARNGRNTIRKGRGAHSHTDAGLSEVRQAD